MLPVPATHLIRPAILARRGHTARPCVVGTAPAVGESGSGPSGWGEAMDEVLGGWARCCLACRRREPPARLVEAECTRQGQVLWAVPGALAFFFPGVAFTFSCPALRSNARAAA